jgi:membrane protease YdiL (CAAX protease family)
MYVTIAGFLAGISVAWDLQTTDVGDVFEKVGRVAEYGSERLQAARAGQPLPSPPKLLADQSAIQLGLAATLLSQVATLAIVGIGSRLSFRDLAHAVGLDRPSFRGAWRPALAVVAGYVGVILYSVAAEATGIDLLEPESTVPTEIVRDDLTMSMAAVVVVLGAPFSEELFFRGFVFSGLLKWGFWAAAPLSGAAFSLFHFDPGSFIPFTLIGMLMAWLYYSRGSLWDAIFFHFLFNATSFVLLAAGS